MDYTGWGYHERGVYPTQNTSRTETAWVKQEHEEDADKNHSKRVV